MEIRKTIDSLKNLRYRLIAEGIGAGICAGIAVSIFRLLIDALEGYREYAKDNLLMTALFLFSCFLLIIAALKWEKNIAGSGIPHVKGELSGQLESSWWRVLIAKILGGSCAIGAGLSVGREGPSVQIGAMAAKGFADLLKRPASEERILLTAGAGAGLAAAFNAPMAGAIFAMEEIHRNLSMEVLLAAMSAAVSSDFISSYVFGLHPVFTVIPANVMPLRLYWLLLVFGILLGISGFLYHWCIKAAQKAYALLPWMPVRIAIPMILAGLLLFTFPDVLGGGNALVDALAAEDFLLKSLLILFAIKFIYSMVSFGSGTPGGIFLPLLVLGALQGSMFAEMTGCGTYLENFIIMGMAGYFTAIVKSPVTGIILISEMTGSLSHLLPLALVCLVSYVTSDLLKTKPIYDQLLERILAKQGKKIRTRRKKTLLDSFVQAGSMMDGKKLSQLGLPGGVLVISIERQGVEIVPHGDTVLMADDDLVLLCEQSLIRETEEILEEKCKTITEGEKTCTKNL